MKKKVNNEIVFYIGIAIALSSHQVTLELRYKGISSS